MIRYWHLTTHATLRGNSPLRERLTRSGKRPREMHKGEEGERVHARARIGCLSLSLSHRRTSRTISLFRPEFDRSDDRRNDDNKTLAFYPRGLLLGSLRLSVRQVRRT